MTALERLIGDYQNLRNGECEANTADRDADIAAVRAEHDALVAALESARLLISQSAYSGSGPSREEAEAIEQIDAALAQAQEQSNA